MAGGGNQVLNYVRPEDIDSCWSFIEPRISEALAYFHDLYSPEDIRTDLKNGDKQLWIIPEQLTVITSIELYPRGKVLRVFSVSGSGLETWFDTALEFCENLARLNGCRMLISTGRSGWSRHTKRHGLKQFAEYRKEIL